MVAKEKSLVGSAQPAHQSPHFFWAEQSRAARFGQAASVAAPARLQPAAALPQAGEGRAGGPARVAAIGMAIGAKYSDTRWGLGRE